MMINLLKERIYQNLAVPSMKLKDDVNLDTLHFNFNNSRIVSVSTESLGRTLTSYDVTHIQSFLICGVKYILN